MLVNMELLLFWSLIICEHLRSLFYYHNRTQFVMNASPSPYLHGTQSAIVVKRFFSGHPILLTFHKTSRVEYQVLLLRESDGESLAMN